MSFVSQARPLQRVDCLASRWEIALRCLFQGHSGDALPHRELIQSFAIDTVDANITLIRKKAYLQ